MGDAAGARAAKHKEVKAITSDRAQAILKVRQREKEALEKWTKEFIKVSST